MGKESKHIMDALKSIVSAQAEQAKTVSKHGKLIESQGRDIAMLEQKVMELRNSAIQAEVAQGIPSRVVAEKYGVSPSRVTQLAPRRGYNG